VCEIKLGNGACRPFEVDEDEGHSNLFAVDFNHSDHVPRSPGIGFATFFTLSRMVSSRSNESRDSCNSIYRRLGSYGVTGRKPARRCDSMRKMAPPASRLLVLERSGNLHAMVLTGKVGQEYRSCFWLVWSSIISFVDSTWNRCPPISFFRRSSGIAEN